jgi:hypothetical protein
MNGTEMMDRTEEIEEQILADYMGSEPVTPSRQRFADKWLAPDPEMGMRRHQWRTMIERASAATAISDGRPRHRRR